MGIEGSGEVLRAAHVVWVGFGVVYTDLCVGASAGRLVGILSSSIGCCLSLWHLELCLVRLSEYGGLISQASGARRDERFGVGS